MNWRNALQGVHSQAKGLLPSIGLGTAWALRKASRTATFGGGAILAMDTLGTGNWENTIGSSELDDSSKGLGSAAAIGALGYGLVRRLDKKGIVKGALSSIFKKPSNVFGTGTIKGAPRSKKELFKSFGVGLVEGAHDAGSGAWKVGSKIINTPGIVAVPVTGYAAYNVGSSAINKSSELLSYNDANYGYMKAEGPPRNIPQPADNNVTPSFRKARQQSKRPIKGGHLGASGDLTLAMHYNRRG